jgi:hypothetical protein
MDNEKRFEEIVMRMFSGEDELVKDDRTVKKIIKQNKLPVQFLRKFDLDFLEFFLDSFFDDKNVIKPYMFMEAVLFKATPMDDLNYQHLKRYRTYVK